MARLNLVLQPIDAASKQPAFTVPVVTDYSKSKVDRAGQLLADRLRSVIDGTAAVGEAPDEVLRAVEVIDWWRGEHARPLSRVAANLRYSVSEHGEPTVTQRLKKFPTIADKLLREPKMKLSRMADIGGVRAVLPDQEAVYRVAARLRRNWTITKFRDYVAEPKDDGYRALHLINRNHGRLIEVQLRTPLQDVWANGVESDARVLAPGLKFGSGPEALRDYYIGLGEFISNAERGIPVDDALLARLVELQQQADTLREVGER